MIKTIALVIPIIMLIGCLDLPTDIEDRQRISSAQVYDAVKAATGFKIAPLDNIYLSYSKEELRDCLETEQWIRDIPYIPEIRDCDDFAFPIMSYIKFLKMPGIALGVIKYRYKRLDGYVYHMANIFMDPNLNIWIIDWKHYPGIFWTYNKNWKVYEVIL